MFYLHHHYFESLMYETRVISKESVIPDSSLFHFAENNILLRNDGANMVK